MINGFGLRRARLFLLLYLVLVPYCVNFASGLLLFSKSSFLATRTVSKSLRFNHERKSLLYSQSADVISPFDASRATQPLKVEPNSLSLTRDNVELVLDEMRPYLKADGGNVRLAEIDGPVVKLELQGACGSCPSSAMTMKMGLERRLKERIPEISEVIQTVPDAPPLTEEGIEKILDGVRPFLSIAGGKISLLSLSGVGSLQPVVTLKMEGTSAALQSVKLEIAQRIQKHFLTVMKIDWADL